MKIVYIQELLKIRKFYKDPKFFKLLTKGLRTESIMYGVPEYLYKYTDRDIRT